MEAVGATQPPDAHCRPVAAVPAGHRASSSDTREDNVSDDDLQGDVRALHLEIDQLRRALTSRATIDQAKGVLMSRYAIDADAAFAVLRRWSSLSNIKLRVIAESVVAIATHQPVPHLEVAELLAEQSAPAVGNELRELLTHLDPPRGTRR